MHEIVIGLQYVNQWCIDSLQASENFFTIHCLTVEVFHLVVVVTVPFACKVDMSDVVCIFAKDLFG